MHRLCVFWHAISVLLIECIGGVVHREIFAFERVRKGVYKGKEWDSIIKPVIEKWGECPGRDTLHNLLDCKNRCICESVYPR